MTTGKMTIRWLRKELAARYGSATCEMTEQDALKFVRHPDKLAVPVQDPNKRRVVMPETAQRRPVAAKRRQAMPLVGKSEYDPHLTAVAWVMDYGRTKKGAGGAELSNAQVIRAGRELGFDVRTVTEMDKDKEEGKGFSAKAKALLADSEFVVMNNTSSFDREQWEALMILMSEREHPFVRYEHDYGFCRRRTSLNCEGRRDTCRTVDHEKQEYGGKGACWQKTIDLYRHVFQASKLSVFIGRDQERIHRDILGDVVDPVWFLTSPVDTDHFRRMKGVRRRRNSVISATGKIHHWVKGQENLLKHIEEHPKLNYSIYSEHNPESEKLFARFGRRVKYQPPLPYEKLPKAYNEHEFVIHLPEGFEPSGRTPIEGFLCGAKPIINERVGSCQLGLDFDDYNGTRERIKNGPYQFWRQLERRV